MLELEPEKLLEHAPAELTLDKIDFLIKEIDRRIARALDAILHHDDFQQLESTWIGIRNLVESVPAELESGDRLMATGSTDDGESSEDGIIISLWNVSKQELFDDLQYSSFRRSALYRKVYRESYSVFGGKPFSILVGDYAFSASAMDCFMLSEVSRVAMESFTVFAAAASPALFGWDSFASLDGLLGGDGHVVADRLSGAIEWEALRSSDEAKFIALSIPRLLGRKPYDYRQGLGESSAFADTRDSEKKHCMRYREAVGSDGSDCLWVNAAFAFAGCVTAAYAQSGWLADIHGLPEGGSGGGIIGWQLSDSGYCRDGESAFSYKPWTEIVIPDQMEKTLSDLGFLTLCHRHYGKTAAFCSTPSIHLPADPSDPDQRLSCLLQYTLCVSRFAHAIKRLGHHKVGQLREADGVRAELRGFLSQFVITNAEAPKHKKAEKPLRGFDLDVQPTPGSNGHFDCDIRLQMHHELDAVEVELKTQLVGMSSSIA